MAHILLLLFMIINDDSKRLFRTWVLLYPTKNPGTIGFLFFSSLYHISAWIDFDKISLKAKIEKTQFFHKMIYDFKGHSRSHKITLLSKTPHFHRFISIKSIKTWDEY